MVDVLSGNSLLLHHGFCQLFSEIMESLWLQHFPSVLHSDFRYSKLWISIHSLHQISPDQMLWRWNISSFSSSSPDRPPPSFGIPKILSLLQPYVSICVESWRSWGWKVLRVFRGGRMNSLNACVFLYFPVWKGPHSPVSSCPHNSCVVLG